MIDIAESLPGAPATAPQGRAPTTSNRKTSIVPRHTTMPTRTQRTPHGDVTLTSRWMRDHYVLTATGDLPALQWMFPKFKSGMERIASSTYRHVFSPAPVRITVERELRHLCAAWQAKWDECLDAKTTLGSAPSSHPIVPQTLKEAYDHHQAHFTEQLGARTQEQYPARMREWFEYISGDIRLEDISAEMILAVRTTMLKEKGSSPTTINTKVATLKKILNLAHRKGWVSRAPWQDVRPLRSIRASVRYWNGEQVALAFSVAKTDREPALATLMLALGIHLGLRKNEAVNLRWKDLILDRLHPHTRNPSPICLIEQRPGFTTKTYENRKIPVSAECMRLLLEHKPVGAEPDDYVLDPEKRQPKRGGTQRVYRYDCRKVWERVLKAAMVLGNPFIEFKEMRHSFACNCLLRGHSVEKVARWLGHKDPRMIRQHYAFLLDYEDDTGLEFLDDA